ncbi:MAG: sigma-70 family RNA polymerase sigma factor [Ruminococcaceae bacterium]|nr:sigma-70 family RNA polymerase sigma factor [Oscillospiraceae bacterium]
MTAGKEEDSVQDRGAESYRRFLQGSDEGLVELVREYKDGLILFMTRYVKDLYVAEELTEDIFFKLMTRKPRFDERSSFKTWLYTIGRNSAIDYIRRFHRASPVDGECLQKMQDEEAELERAYLKAEQKIIVNHILQQLAPEYARVLHLRYFEELDNEQVAAVMRISNQQARNMLYRARQKLKTELEKAGFEYEEL